MKGRVAVEYRPFLIVVLYTLNHQILSHITLSNPEIISIFGQQIFRFYDIIQYFSVKIIGTDRW